ncbi:MAG: phosphoribosylglycinamide formyltransferase [Prevotellaceae bacterium]|nr:phosphoribosylglycinamide formyltransferase [Candidatus Faecinaster equi]
MKNIAIFASGSGTNAENIIKYFANSTDIAVKVVIYNKQDAGVVERATRLGIPSVYLNKADMTDETKVIATLDEYAIDYIILSGYLLLFPEYLLDKYKDKVLNIHPALLPKHGGKGFYGDKVHADVLKCGDKETGITIHVIDKNFDQGKTIFQAKCEVKPGDTVHDVAIRVHTLEYEWFPKIIEKYIKGV